MDRRQKLFTIIGVVGVLVVIVLLIWRSQFSPSSNGLAEVTFSIADSTTGPAMYKIVLTDPSVWHPDRGWTRISSTDSTLSAPVTGDEDETALTRRLPQGDYSRVRFTVAEVTLGGADTDTTARLLHDTVTIPITLTIAPGTHSRIGLSLQLPESLYQEPNGSIVFVPSVVATVAYVEVEEQTSSILLNQTFGMDQYGQMRINYRLPRASEFVSDGDELRVTLPNQNPFPLPITEATTTETASTTVEAADLEESEIDDAPLEDTEASGVSEAFATTSTSSPER